MRRQTEANETTSVKKILIGAPTGLIGALDFDANNPGFTLVANSTINGTSPSWMAFQEPNRLYAVDENTNTTRLFNVCCYSPRKQIT